MKNTFKTKDGITINLDEETCQHLAAHSQITEELLGEAIGLVELGNRPFYMESVDLQKTIGTDGIVPNSLYGAGTLLKRKNRKGLTPCLVGYEGVETSLITIGICLFEGKFYLFTAFTGQKVPKEPWDETLKDSEKKESEEFWNTHSLCVTKEELEG